MIGAGILADKLGPSGEEIFSMTHWLLENVRKRAVKPDAPGPIFQSALVASDSWS
jgi:hypothetical protein